MDFGPILILLLVAAAAGAARGVGNARFAMFAGTGDVDDAALEDVGVELQRLREEQRRLPESLLTLLHEANTAHLDHAERRATAELDGKKALIDQGLGTLTDELGRSVSSSAASTPTGRSRTASSRTSCNANTKD